MSTPSPQSIEICRDLLRQNIADNIDAMIRELDAAMPCITVKSDAALLHFLRRARADWNSISADAKELAERAEGGAK
jgi:hypothetical protein